MNISKFKVVLVVCMLTAAGALMAQSTTAPSGKSSSAPTTQAATAPANTVTIKPSGPGNHTAATAAVTPTNVGAVYVGILLRSKDLAKLAVSQANMSAVGKTLMMYVQENDKFPASLEELKMNVASPGDPTKKFTYVKGQMPNSPAGNIVAYDPVSYGGKIVVLKVDGSVETLASEEEMSKRMGSQK